MWIWSDAFKWPHETNLKKERRKKGISRQNQPRVLKGLADNADFSFSPLLRSYGMHLNIPAEIRIRWFEGAPLQTFQGLHPHMQLSHPRTLPMQNDRNTLLTVPRNVRGDCFDTARRIELWCTTTVVKGSIGSDKSKISKEKYSIKYIFKIVRL